MYAEERWHLFQSLLVPGHLALSCGAVVCPAHCPASGSAPLADQLPGLYGCSLQSLCPCSGVWGAGNNGILLASPGLYWHGVPDWYSESHRALWLRTDTVSHVAYGDESSAE